MSKVILTLLVFLCVTAGSALGYMLRPSGDLVDARLASEKTIDNPVSHEDVSGIESEYVKLNNQFIVPVVVEDTVSSLVVVSLSLEVISNQTGIVFSAEPKLRDAFLQVLFDYANMGGFDGEFTNSRNTNVLREALTDTAQRVLGDLVVSVLITDLARQDV